MKKLLIVFVLLAMVFATGCLPNFIDGGPSEPEVVEPKFTVEVHAILEQREDEVADSLTFGEDLWGIAYTIENTCEIPIATYKIGFTLRYDTEEVVKYADVTQYVTGEKLWPGVEDKQSGWKQLLIADEEPKLLDGYTVDLE